MAVLKANKTHTRVCAISESLAMGLADMVQGLRKTYALPELQVDA